MSRSRSEQNPFGFFFRWPEEDGIPHDRSAQPREHVSSRVWSPASRIQPPTSSLASRIASVPKRRVSRAGGRPVRPDAGPRQRGFSYKGLTP